MYKAYDNGQGGIAHECVPDDYVAKPGEVLFPDCPGEEEKLAAFPTRSAAPAREKGLAERLDEVEALVRHLDAMVRQLYEVRLPEGTK